MKRTLAALLALLLALPILAACSGGGSDPAVSTTAGGNASASSAAPETTAPDPALIDELPASKDLGGYKFTVLSHLYPASSVAWMVADIWTESENGERINDAVYARNLAMEERFNVKVTPNQPDNNPEKVAQQLITAGSDEYDILQCDLSRQTPMVTGGYVLNMKNVEYLNFEKAWWDRESVRTLEVLGKIWLAGGDSQLNTFKSTWATLFNKKLAEDAGITGLYDTVKEGKWTIDLLKTYGKRVAKDLNGDGKMEWGTDLFGIFTQNEIFEPFVLGTGIKTVEVDAKGGYSYNLNTEPFVTAMEKVWKFLNEDNDCILKAESSSASDKWIQARSLFASDMYCFFLTHLGTPTLVGGDMNSDFGILPFPMLDENQGGYHSTCQRSNYHAISIPKTASDPSRTGLLTEAYEMLAHSTIRPAYYDYTLTLRAARDTESGEMLDIIFGTRTLDIADHYNVAAIYDVMKTATASTTFNYASTEAANRESYKKLIEDFIKQMSAYDN